MLKFGVTIAFPGTPMFRDYRRRKLIRSYNWDEYFMYTGKELFAHPLFSADRVRELMADGYRRAVLLNPGFVLRRLWLALRTGALFRDLYYLVRFVAAPSLNAATHTAVYFAKDRWPVFDFAGSELTHYPPRPANNRLTGEMIEGTKV
jgi:hypothetical protein